MNIEKKQRHNMYSKRCNKNVYKNRNTIVKNLCCV